MIILVVVAGAMFLFSHLGEFERVADDAPVHADSAPAANQAASVLSFASESTPTYEVTASSLRLRASPSAAAEILGRARRGERVDVFGQRGAWFDVRLRSGARGWMHGDHLAPVGLQSNPDLKSASALPSRKYGSAVAVGRASVTDGDTIRITDTRIRLHGIDAPESGQSCEDAAGRLYPCGGRAANALHALVGQQTVSCQRKDTDRYGRMVGVCELLATGTSLNAYMVRSGWALAYRQYSGDYVVDEQAAREKKIGLWQGRFVPPWDHRKGIRLERGAAKRQLSDSGPPRATNTTSERRGCKIKGNISKAGKIYHVPGSRSYERTRIDTSRGERWFCSESEAQAAGWRAPRR